MAETAANTYATTGANAAAGTPNQVAVDVDTAGFERQIVQIGDKTSNNVSVHPATFLRVTDEPRQLFYDPFDAALDTTNLWTAPTTGNSAVAASVTTGLMSLGTGTTASGWSKLTSQATFKPSVPSWLGFSSAIQLPDGAAPTANSYRFWGAGTTPGTPTTAAPVTDGIGFEISTAGKMYAVVYAGGTRTQIADLSSTGTNKQPLDANQHRYVVYVRTDRSYWYIDGLDGASLVATSSFQAPQVQTLPVLMLCVGGATPPASNTQIQCNGTAVWDEGKNNTQLSDGTYPWRKASVSAVGQLSVASTDTTVTGTIAAVSATVQLDLNGAGSVTVNAAGALSASTVVFEWTADGITWTSWPVMSPGSTNGTTNTPTSSSTFGFANVLFWGMAPGFKSVRVRCTVYGSGSTLVTMRSSSSTALGYYPTQVNSPGDGIVQPTSIGMSSVYGQTWNASTWDRVRSVLNGTNSTGTGITAAGVVAQFDDVSPTSITENQFGNLRMSANRNMYTTIRDAAGNERGVNVDASGNMGVMHTARTATSGLAIAKILAAATTNATLVLTGVRAVYGWHLVNTAASVRYVRFFNKATAPTPGTDSPIFVIPLPASGGAVMQPGIMNIAFSLGFGYTITAAAADLDATTTAANDVVGTIWYA